jgi:hypothetical protein
MESGRYWGVLALCHGRAHPVYRALDRIGPPLAMLLPDEHPNSVGPDNKMAKCGPMWSRGARAPW